jgi:hypothetical protein
MNTETGFDILWEDEGFPIRLVVDEMGFHFPTPPAVVDAVIELCKSPAFRMLTGIKPT